MQTKITTRRRAILAGAAAVTGGAKAKATPLNRPFARQVEAYERGKLDHNLGRYTVSADTPSEAFGLKMVGNCLAPRAVDGQIVVVESKLPEPGDLAVFWFKGQAMPAVKILCSPIVGYPLHPESECIPIIEAEQLNPPKRYCVGLDKIECIARVHSVMPAQPPRKAVRA
jgi:hypothetical protein